MDLSKLRVGLVLLAEGLKAIAGALVNLEPVPRQEPAEVPAAPVIEQEPAECDENGGGS